MQVHVKQIPIGAGIPNSLNDPASLGVIWMKILHIWCGNVIFRYKY